MDNKDIDQINSWLNKRGRLPISHDVLPSYSKVIPNVCCGFLVKTDTDVAIIDFLISNPDCSMSERYNGIITVIMDLMNHAKMLGFKKIRSDTNIRSVINLALRLGFHCIESKWAFFKEIE